MRNNAVLRISDFGQHAITYTAPALHRYPLRFITFTGQSVSQ